MGYGTGPFGSALGIYPPPPGPEQPSDISSSRAIDGEKKTYVLNAQGGFASMNDTDQRVLLTLCFADVDTPFITPQDFRTQELNIRNALAAAGLTDIRSPAIQILRLSVGRGGSGTTEKILKYKNLLTNTEQTIKR